MEIAGQFTLIKGDEEPKKLKFPRFPFCFLSFKTDSGESDHVFEVKDISKTGMQLALKDGGHSFQKDNPVQGQLGWLGENLKVEGKVVWTMGSRVGIEFSQEQDFQEKVNQFLCAQNIAKAFKALHSYPLDFEIPNNLKYWLSADGPCEVFIWKHIDGEISGFQMILFENLVEWKDGQGLKSGRVLTKRDVDTPLVSEDEFVFQQDTLVNMDKVAFAYSVAEQLQEKHLPLDLIKFLQRKLKH